MQKIRCFRCGKEREDGIRYCPYCGYEPENETRPLFALKKDIVLRGRYQIGNVIGQGGFGITYAAFDQTLQLRVAVKEYFPMGKASRSGSYSSLVQWNYKKWEEKEWSSGLERFLKEARRMAALDSVPFIVRVRDVFEENQTAYIVMDFVEGVTLKNYLDGHGLMREEECCHLLSPILDSLSVMHEKKFIHRDISPDNIMIQPDGAARLLDMGAVVDVQANAGLASMAVARRNFSAPEQYLEKGVLGSWTDVYAMAATIYYCITGRVVPDAMERGFGGGKLNFPETGRVSEPMTAALSAALELKVEDRTQNIGELKRQLLAALRQKEPARETQRQTESLSDADLLEETRPWKPEESLTDTGKIEKKLSDEKTLNERQQEKKSAEGKLPERNPADEKSADKEPVPKEAEHFENENEKKEKQKQKAPDGRISGRRKAAAVLLAAGLGIVILSYTVVRNVSGEKVRVVASINNQEQETKEAGELAEPVDVTVEPIEVTVGTEQAKEYLYDYDADGFFVEEGKTYYEPAEKNAEDVYEISNAGQLFWFASLVNGDAEQEEIAGAVSDADAALIKDIVVPDGFMWTPIGNYSEGIGKNSADDRFPYGQKYGGTFDGRGRTISGLTISAEGLQLNAEETDDLQSVNVYYGLFGRISGGTAKNIKLQDNDIYVAGTEEVRIRVGGIAGSVFSQGEVSDCVVIGTVSVTTYGYNVEAGGIVGDMGRDGMVSNCENGGSVSAVGENLYVGGIVGHTQDSGGMVNNCTNRSEVSVTVSGRRVSCVGGIVGRMSNNSMVSGCKNSGAVDAVASENNDYVSASGGGIVGDVINESMDGMIRDCINTGTVGNRDTKITYAGGIVGNLFGGAVSGCENSGDVNALYVAGGIAGNMNFSTDDNNTTWDAFVSDCKNSGTVCTRVLNDTSYLNAAGGIVGVLSGGSITGCYSIGVVSSNVLTTGEGAGSAYVGGITGSQGGNESRCCYLTGMAEHGVGFAESERTYSDVGAVSMTDKQFANGEALALLNRGTDDGTQAWRQTIGVDPYPVLNVRMDSR